MKYIDYMYRIEIEISHRRPFQVIGVSKIYVQDPPFLFILRTVSSSD